MASANTRQTPGMPQTALLYFQQDIESDLENQAIMLNFFDGKQSESKAR